MTYPVSPGVGKTSFITAVYAQVRCCVVLNSWVGSIPVTPCYEA